MRWTMHHRAPGFVHVLAREHHGTVGAFPAYGDRLASLARRTHRKRLMRARTAAAGR